MKICRIITYEIELFEKNYKIFYFSYSTTVKWPAKTDQQVVELLNYYYWTELQQVVQFHKLPINS